MVRLKVVIACSVLVGCLLFTLSKVQARDSGQWEAGDPEIRAWFEMLMQPDNPHVPCCGAADAYWADTVEVEGDRVFAIITDTRPDEPLRRPHIAPGTRFEIPKNKYKFDAGNPTGHHVLFVGAGGVYCFVQGSGA